MTRARPRYRQWLRVSARYLAAISAGHLVWEIVQLPLYTIWWESGMDEIGFAIAHCTVGDLLIAATALAIGILLFGRTQAPDAPKTYARVAAVAILLGVVYTVFSERYNTQTDGSWTYSAFMPVVPPFDVGLSPLLQWILVPGIAFYWLRPGRPLPDLQPSSTSPTGPRKLTARKERP